jgi:uncharacterized protein YndB with AHSA1/START domain
MTRQRSFKNLVRARMAKTGESYTAARAKLLAAEPVTSNDDAPLVTSDDAIRERTGRGWERWFDLLDSWGAIDKPHRDIARFVAAELGIDPLAWNAQAITTSYERARRGRQVGERSDGFGASVTRTVAVSPARLYDAMVDDALRQHWLPGAKLTKRTATRPERARFDWDGGPSRVHVIITPKDGGKSRIALDHVRLTDADEVVAMRSWWRERLSHLKTWLEEEGNA